MKSSSSKHNTNKAMDDKKSDSLSTLCEKYYSYYDIDAQDAYRTLQCKALKDGKYHTIAEELEHAFEETTRSVFPKTQQTESKNDQRQKEIIEKNKEDLVSTLYYASSVKESTQGEVLSSKLFYTLMDIFIEQYDNQSNKPNRNDLVELIFAPLKSVMAEQSLDFAIMDPVKEKLRQCLLKETSNTKNNYNYNRPGTRALIAYMESLYIYAKAPVAKRFDHAIQRAIDAPGGIAWKRGLINLATLVFFTTVITAAFYFAAPIAFTLGPVLTLLGSAVGIALPITTFCHLKLFKPYHWGEGNNVTIANKFKIDDDPIDHGHYYGRDNLLFATLNFANNDSGEHTNATRITQINTTAPLLIKVN